MGLSIGNEEETDMGEMKVGILAGGAGRRLLEETAIKPKPMVEIGNKPILWHIMKHYALHGFTRFVIAAGYKGEMIRDYFERNPEKHWEVDIVDTGINTQTGGRIKRLAPFLEGRRFLLTWGDAVSDIDLGRQLAFHESHGRLATVTAVNPPPRFGHLKIEGDRVVRFEEKPVSRNVWINGAFFVLERDVFDYIPGDETAWEMEPMQRLARDGQLMAYRHFSFWQCMDTLYDRHLLEELWQSGRAPWRTWE